MEKQEAGSGYQNQGVKLKKGFIKWSRLIKKKKSRKNGSFKGYLPTREVNILKGEVELHR